MHPLVVVPGAPENVVAIDVSSNSLRLQVNLSSIGTSPILAVSFLISGPDGFMIISNITENLNIGGPVEAYVNGLSPGTLYSVVVYATNAAGSGPTSVKQNFETCESAKAFVGVVHGILRTGILYFIHGKIGAFIKRCSLQNLYSQRSMM